MWCFKEFFNLEFWVLIGFNSGWRYRVRAQFGTNTRSSIIVEILGPQNKLHIWEVLLVCENQFFVNDGFFQIQTLAFDNTFSVDQIKNNFVIWIYPIEFCEKFVFLQVQLYQIIFIVFWTIILIEDLQIVDGLDILIIGYGVNFYNQFAFFGNIRDSVLNLIQVWGLIFLALHVSHLYVLNVLVLFFIFIYF